MSGCSRPALFRIIRSHSRGACLLKLHLEWKETIQTWIRLLLPSWSGRFENQYLFCFFFSRAFRALMPRRDRNAVKDTIIIATAPSAWCQNKPQTMSPVWFWTRPETRMMAMTIMQTFKHKKIPTKNFCWSLIFTFQSKIRGIKMTMSPF